jgi:5-hydroxyisourate hydrolase-like protein (transthyretin family)
MPGPYKARIKFFDKEHSSFITLCDAAEVDSKLDSQMLGTGVFTGLVEVTKVGSSVVLAVENVHANGTPSQTILTRFQVTGNMSLDLSAPDAQGNRTMTFDSQSSRTWRLLQDIPETDVLYSLVVDYDSAIQDIHARDYVILGSDLTANPSYFGVVEQRLSGAQLRVRILAGGVAAGGVYQYAARGNFPMVGKAKDLYLAKDTMSVWFWVDDGMGNVGYIEARRTVRKFANRAAFPAVGNDAVLYVAMTGTTDKGTYVWDLSTSAYTQVGSYITPADQNKWNNHVADTTVHVTQAYKDATAQAILDNTNALAAHILDSVKHITAAERISWNAKIDLDQLIDALKAKVNKTYTNPDGSITSYLDTGGIVRVYLDGSYDKFFTEADGGGYEHYDASTNNILFVGADGGNGLEIYDKDATTGEGIRVRTRKGADGLRRLFYEKDNTNAEPVPDDEVATWEKLADAIQEAVLSIQKWLPAVTTVDLLPTPPDIDHTWLCRVTETNTVYQCVQGQTDWEPYSSNTDYVDELELDNAVSNLVLQINAKYTKPSTGIPLADLSQEVFDRLSLVNIADTTLVPSWTPAAVLSYVSSAGDKQGFYLVGTNASFPTDDAAAWIVNTVNVDGNKIRLSISNENGTTWEQIADTGAPVFLRSAWRSSEIGFLLDFDFAEVTPSGGIYTFPEDLFAFSGTPAVSTEIHAINNPSLAIPRTYFPGLVGKLVFGATGGIGIIQSWMLNSSTNKWELSVKDAASTIADKPVNPGKYVLQVDSDGTIIWVPDTGGDDRPTTQGRYVLVVSSGGESSWGLLEMPDSPAGVTGVWALYTNEDGSVSWVSIPDDRPTDAGLYLLKVNSAGTRTWEVAPITPQPTPAPPGTVDLYNVKVDDGGNQTLTPGLVARVAVDEVAAIQMSLALGPQYVVHFPSPIEESAADVTADYAPWTDWKGQNRQLGNRYQYEQRLYANRLVQYFDSLSDYATAAGPTATVNAGQPVVTANGLVAIPGYTGSSVGRLYDPVSNSLVATLPTGTQYCLAGCLLPDGNVFFASYSASYASVVINPVALTLVRTAPLTSAVRAVALLPNGKVFCLGYSSVKSVVYDPYSNTYTDAPVLTGVFQAAQLMPNGRVFCVNYSGGTCQVYNPSTNGFASVTLPSGDALTGYVDAVLMDTGKIALLPGTAGQVALYDPNTGLVELKLSVTGLAHGVRLADGRILATLASSSSGRLIERELTTSVTISLLNLCNCMALLPSGQVLAVGGSSSVYSLFSPYLETLNLPMELVTSPFYNGG